MALFVLQPTLGGLFMSKPKVIKSYSLEIDTVQLIERHCIDTWDKKASRSRLVNESIKWYLTGDVAELKRERDDLHERWLELVNEKHHSKVSETQNQSWWRRLLLGR